jgi:hypothetical protein
MPVIKPRAKGKKIAGLRFMNMPGVGAG